MWVCVCGCVCVRVCAPTVQGRVTSQWCGCVTRGVGAGGANMQPGGRHCRDLHHPAATVGGARWGRTGTGGWRPGYLWPCPLQDICARVPYLPMPKDLGHGATVGPVWRPGLVTHRWCGGPLPSQGSPGRQLSSRGGGRGGGYVLQGPLQVQPSAGDTQVLPCRGLGLWRWRRAEKRGSPLPSLGGTLMPPVGKATGVGHKWCGAAPSPAWGAPR